MYRYFFLITALFVIGFSSLVSIPTSPYLLNGLTQKDISDTFLTAITPAAFTFSIWSIIYLSWVILGIALMRQKISLTKKQTSVFCVVMLLTGIWLIPWAYLWIGTALTILLVILGTTWYLFYLTYQKSSPYISNTVELLMGWIHIAFFANLAVGIEYAGIAQNPSESLYWGIGILTIAFFATIFFQIRFRTFIVSAVYLWASMGIYFGQPSTLLTLFLGVYALGILSSIAYTLFHKRLEVTHKTSGE